MQQQRSGTLGDVRRTRKGGSSQKRQWREALAVTAVSVAAATHRLPSTRCPLLSPILPWPQPPRVSAVPMHAPCFRLASTTCVPLCHAVFCRVSSSYTTAAVTTTIIINTDTGVIGAKLVMGRSDIDAIMVSVTHACIRVATLYQPVQTTIAQALLLQPCHHDHHHQNAWSSILLAIRRQQITAKHNTDDDPLSLPRLPAVPCLLSLLPLQYSAPTLPVGQ